MADCAQKEAAAATRPMSYTRDVQPILDENCVICHQADSAQEGLVLEAPMAFANIVGHTSVQAPIPLISPGAPNGSYLYRKIVGTQKDVGGRGEKMPFAGHIDGASVNAICRWIAQGADNN